MRFVALAISMLLLTACPELGTGTSAEGADGGAGTAGTAGGSSSSASCSGFIDVLGRCGDLSCLDTPSCTPSDLSGCAAVAQTPAICAGTHCAFVQLGIGCSSPADCPCGLCGQDGQCYADSAGTCGRCTIDTGDGDTTTKPTDAPACKACLSDCTGTGPSCCAGCGCACEGVCGVCN